MEFYLRLPSDSCTDIIPSNTASDYVTILPQNIQLNGNYEVALTEINYKTSWENFILDETKSHVRILLPVKAFKDQVEINDSSSIGAKNSLSYLYTEIINLLEKYSEQNLTHELGEFWNPKGSTYDDFIRNIKFLIDIYQHCSIFAKNEVLNRIASEKKFILEQALTKLINIKKTPIKIRPEFTELCSQLFESGISVCEYPTTKWTGKTNLSLDKMQLDFSDGINIAIDLKFKNGYFKTVNDLIKHLNSAIYNNGYISNLQNLIKFYYHDFTKQIYVLCSKSIKFEILDEDFADIIKIEPNILYNGIKSNENPITFFEDYKLMYLYSDVVDYSVVGNSNAQLLRSFPSNNDKSGQYVVENFNNPYYIPVKVNNFSTVEIKILNEYGKAFKFTNSKTNIVLHFRQLSSLG